MKKILALLVAAVFVFAACQKSATTEDFVADETIPAGRYCASNEVLEEQMKADPGLRRRMQEIEAFTQRVLENPSAYKVLADGTLELPVHVNVLYRSASENVSDAQIQSQIDVLNEDFGATNSDYSSVPSIFQGVRSGDIKIRFVWNFLNVTRKSTKKKSWGTNDAMKKSTMGGIDPTNCSTTLNIWVCNLSNGILGYAQFPGGNCATDGIVIDNNAFGRGSSYNLYAAFDKGRTATHEVGHYFNLRHIWGDATCGNDLVGDTPQHNTANYGCPAYPHYSTCSGNPVEMTMNYMDYTNDECMFMFTAGQGSRMQATYAVGGPRASLR